MNRAVRTLSTKISVEEYREFAERAKQLGITPSALLRRVVLEFLEKPIEKYDRVAKLERELEKLKSEVLEMRARIDMLTRRIAFLERRRGVYPRRETKEEG